MIYHPNIFKFIDQTMTMKSANNSKQPSLVDVIVARLNKYMGELDLSRYKLSQLSGVPIETIKSIMKKQTKNISLKTVIMLANGLGMTVSEFLDDDNFSSEFLGWN